MPISLSNLRSCRCGRRPDMESRAEKDRHVLRIRLWCKNKCHGAGFFIEPPTGNATAQVEAYQRLFQTWITANRAPLGQGVVSNGQTVP